MRTLIDLQVPRQRLLPYLSETAQAWLASARSDPHEFLRNSLMATLPFGMLLISPERPLVSYLLAPAWLAAGILLSRRRGRNAAPLAYAGVAVAFIALAVVRTYVNGSLSAEQKGYGLFKAEYFVAVMLPLGLAVALIVDRADDFKPSMLTLLVLGLLLSVPTILLRDTAVLGAGRYGWQGILMALAAVLLLQFWLIRRVSIATVLVIACVIGAALTLSRQAILATMTAMVFTTAYWLMVRHRTHATARLQVRWRWLVPLGVLIAVASGITTLLALSLLRAWDPNSMSWLPDVSNCQCTVGRFRELFFLNSAPSYGGDHSRVSLLHTGWRDFLKDPVNGTGLGSLSGLVKGFQDNQWITYHYPHNIWLELGAEVGVPGLLVLVGPLVLGYVLLWREGMRTQSQAISSLLCVVCIFAVVVSLAGDLPAARTLWIFAIPGFKLGVASCYIARKEEA